MNSPQQNPEPEQQLPESEQIPQEIEEQDQEPEESQVDYKNVRLTDILKAKFPIFHGLFSAPARPKSHLDAIKILAIFLVLLNHTGSNLFTQYTTESGTIAHWLMLAHSVFIKAAVPLFFMSSGALLLGRNEPYAKLLSKRVLRFVFTLLAVSVITYQLNLKSGASFSISEFLTKLYRGNIATHLWYLYAYICLLMTIPFMRKIAQHMEQMDFYWLIVLQLIESSVAFLDYFFFRGSASHSWSFTFFTATRGVLYPLLGYYMENKMTDEKYTTEGFVQLLVLTLMSIYLTCLMKEWRVNVDGGWNSSNTEVYLDSIIVFPSILVYYGAKLWFIRLPASPRLGKILFNIGSYTFGVYLLEGFFRKWTVGVRNLLRAKTGLYFATWVQILAALLLGLLVTFAYKTLWALISETFKRIFGRKEAQE